MKNNEFSISDYVKYSLIKGPVTVEKIQVMHGANYFSGGPIVLFRINLNEFNEVYSNQIQGFYDRLCNDMPSLYEHHCSEGRKGGFFFRVQQGTLLGHIIEHVAIEMQTLAGMDVGFGKTRSTLKEGVYNVVFRFFDEVAGEFAGKAAINFINSILLQQDFDIENIINSLIDIREKRLLGPSTQAIVDEAKKRKIPCLRLDAFNLVQLGTGKYLKRIRATITSQTNMLAVETADNKYLTALMLADAGVPVPATIRTTSIEEAFQFYETQNKPIVIKPSDGYHGKYVGLNLSNKKEIEIAFKDAQQFDDMVLLQTYTKGKIFRLLVIDYKFSAATQLVPPFVVGNGVNTIQELVDIENSKHERQVGDKTKLSKIVLNETSLNIIQHKGYTLQSILDVEEKLFLQNSGSLRLGGESIDCTEEIHPTNKFLAERAAKIIGLNVAGVDIICEDISQSIIETNGVIIEVNAAPDFRMHLFPNNGKSRNVAFDLMNMLYTPKTKTHIPIFSITGTAGKTIAVTFINYCLQLSGYKTGIATSEGLYVNGSLLKEGDTTFPEYVNMILKDPTVDCAVLETSREGILRNGLGYELADIGVVLNMYDDHVGNDDIKYIEDLAYAKSVVVEELYDDGYAILNADIDLVYEMKDRVKANLILFSKSFDNKHIKTHTLKGGKAIYVKNNAITVFINFEEIVIANINDVPLLFNGKALFMLDSILASIAALIAFGIEPAFIRERLFTFVPNPELLKGRMNELKFGNIEILIDNAHNVINFISLKQYIDTIEKYKVGVLDAAGDRSDEVIVELGAIAAQTYNEIYIYEGFDARGREVGETTNLLVKGILSAGFDSSKIKQFLNPTEAWLKALENSNENTYTVILTPKSKETIEVVNKYFSQ